MPGTVSSAERLPSARSTPRQVNISPSHTPNVIADAAHATVQSCAIMDSTMAAVLSTAKSHAISELNPKKRGVERRSMVAVKKRRGRRLRYSLRDEGRE